MTAASTDETDGRRDTAAARIVGVLAAAYRRQGYHSIAVPVAALGGIVASDQLEPVLARLLDHGYVVPVGRNGITLHPSARLGALSAAVLEGWHAAISRETGPTRSLHVDNVATELRRLVDWACAADLPDDLAQRGAELAGVLVTEDLDPRAMELVRVHGGTPRSRLAALAASAARTCADLTALVVLLRRDVSTVRPT